MSLGVGSALAEARKAQGLELADIAQQLKFMPRQIESLEAERFEALPGPTIARGMVRTYARFLKLDPEPLLERMAGRVVAPDATPQLAARFSQPVPFSDHGKRSTLVYLALSAVVLAVAGAILYEWRHERALPQFIAAAEGPAEKSPPKASKAVKQQAPAPAAKAVVAPPAPAPRTEVAAAPKPQPPAAEPAPAEPLKTAPVAKEAKDAAAPKAAGGNRLVLRFEEDAWAEVTDAAGRHLLSSLNPAGTERVVRGTPPFTLVIGNAQHVKVSYNDREIDLLPHVKVEVARLTIK